jgi:anti-sigma factor RsiW
VTIEDHSGYRDDVGAYLLGALPDAERAAFEAHLEGCAECREEVERLRPAAELLPRSVEQVEPPPSLKRSLMEVVEREAGGVPARRPSPRWRLRGLLRPVVVAGALAVGLIVGFAVAQLGGDDTRTLAADVNERVLPDASGRLVVQGDGEDGGILRVQGMPPAGDGRVYQAWVQRDGMVEPQQTFEVGADGGGAVAVPENLSDAEAVLLTREQRGGAMAPSEDPILAVDL